MTHARARLSSLLLGLALAGGLLAGECEAAHAGEGATADVAISAATADWSATLASADQQPSPGSFTVSWVVVKGRQYGFVDIVNSGSLDLSGLTLSLATTATGSVPTMGIDACTVSWTQNDAGCTGTSSSIWSTSGGTADLRIGLSAGGRVRLRLTTGEKPSNQLVTTMGVDVSRSQARSAMTVTQ